MALVVKDRIKETSSTTGQNDLTLGGAVDGFRTFADVGDGNTTYYAIVDGNNFEVGLGTYSTSGPTLARTTVLQTSAGNTTKISCTGSQEVFVTQPADKAVFTDASDNLTFTGGIAQSGGQATFNSGTTNTVATFTSTDSVAEIQMTDSTGTAGISAEGDTFQVRPAGGVSVLDINSTSATFTGTVNIGTTGSLSNNSGTFLIDANTNLNFRGGTQTFDNADGSTEYMRLNSTGLGIGSSSPDRIFTINNGGPVVEIDPAGASSNPIYFNYNRSTSAYLTPQYWALGHKFMNNGGDLALEIDSSGNVGIGASPSSLLTVHGSQPVITLSDSDTSSTSTISGNSGHLIFNADSGQDASSNTIDFQVDNDQKMRITTDGTVGINTTTIDANNFGAGAGILTVASDTGSAKTAMLNLIGDGNDTDGTRVASLFYNDASATGAGATLAGIEAYRASNHATDPGANLLFNTNSSGGAYSEKMRITSGGDVTVTGGTLSVTTNSATGGTDTANALEIYKSGETTVSQNVLVYSDANGYSNGWCINMDENTGGSVTRQSNSYKSLFYFQDIRTTSSPNEKHNFGEWDGTNFKPLCYMYTSTDGTDDDASNVEVLASGANSTNANAWLNIRSKGVYYGGLNYYSDTTHIGSILGHLDGSQKELRTYIGGSGTYPQANGTYVTRIKADGTFVIKTNLGIGEDSPDYPLHITHSNPVVKLEADGNNDRGIRLYGGTTEKASILWNEGNANFFFKNFRTDANISYANIGFFTGGGTASTPALRLNINYAGAIGFTQSGNTTSTNQDPNNMEYGSSGQVLTSNGNISPPTWQTSSGMSVGKSIALGLAFG